MTSEDPTKLPQAHRLRLLWPFFYARESVAPATAALTALTHTARKTWPCWSTAGAVPTLYRDEALPHLRDFLFGTGAGGCAYLCVPDVSANTWFKNGVVCAPDAAQSDPKDADRPREFAVRLAAPGIELFLSPHGVGLLSVTLAPAEGPTDLVAIQDFNYRLAQGRPFTAWHLRLPHGERHPEPPPDAAAPLTERLGRPGGAFQLVEWVEFLLGPLAGGLDYWPVQEQFAVYSVTRFCTWADLADPAVAAALRPFLTALAHVEEGGHPGSLAVTAQTFNPRHWAAVGSLGTAHLIADQDPARDFDAQRLPTVLYKYFIPYLVGLLQRVALHRLLVEARAACAEAPGAGADLAARLGCLHRHALHLTVNGTFTEVSSREVLNQYYALTRTGLRVADSLGTLQRALRDAKAQDNDRFQGEALGELRALAAEAGHHARLVAHVQS
jgi:hypothetical protein